jgi:hypothetical protein
MRQVKHKSEKCRATSLFVSPQRSWRRLMRRIFHVGLVSMVPVVGMPIGMALADNDPPSRVGRLTNLEGTVSFHTADQTTWGAASPNYPITSGNAIWADNNSHASVQIGANAVNLAPLTELDVNQLDDQSFQASVSQGEVYLDLRQMNNGDSYQVATPRGTVTINQPGRYEVTSGDQTHPGAVTVYEGAAQVTGDNVNLAVGPGQVAVLSDDGQGGPVQADMQVVQGEDQLIAWARSREPRMAPPQAAVGMTGTQDLAQYGSWSNSPDYGAVWYPQVAAGWVPYREGHWAWVAPWGWTWVDDAPWGFAPFHYGRWVQIGPRWAWAPRPVVVVAEPIPVIPIYAPALVSFVGNIGGIGIGITIGGPSVGPSVGWVPLGPREVYYPPYRVSPRYARNVNVTYVKNVNIINVNNTTINNITVNRFANHNAVTVVSRDAMLQSRHVAGVVQHVNQHDLDNMHGFGGGQPPLHPTAETAGLTPHEAKQFNVSPQQLRHDEAPGPKIGRNNGQGGFVRSSGNAGKRQLKPAGDAPMDQVQNQQQNQNRYPNGNGARPSTWPSQLSHKPGAPVDQQASHQPVQGQQLPMIGGNQGQDGKLKNQPQNQQMQGQPQTDLGRKNGNSQQSTGEKPGQGNWNWSSNSQSRQPGAAVTLKQNNWQQGNGQQRQNQPQVQTSQPQWKSGNQSQPQQITAEQKARQPNAVERQQNNWQQSQHQQNNQTPQYQAEQNQAIQQRAQQQQLLLQQRQSQQQQHKPQGQQYQPQQVQHTNQQDRKSQGPVVGQPWQQPQ